MNDSVDEAEIKRTLGVHVIDTHVVYFEKILANMWQPKPCASCVLDNHHMSNSGHTMFYWNSLPWGWLLIELGFIPISLTLCYQTPTSLIGLICSRPCSNSMTRAMSRCCNMRSEKVLRTSVLLRTYSQQSASHDSCTKQATSFQHIRDLLICDLPLIVEVNDMTASWKCSPRLHFHSRFFARRATTTTTWAQL